MYALPLICIDTGGYTNNFDKSHAIIMDRSNRDKLVLDLTEAIIRLTDNDTRKFMSCAARQKGLELTWSSKGKKYID